MVNPIGSVNAMSAGVGQIGGIAPGTSSAAGVAKSSSTGAAVPFAELVQQLIQDTNSQQAGITQGVQDLVAGDADSIHDIVLTAARADLAFQLVMEIRNKLISSYQEVMRMQV